jgi:hypothetical protein
MVYSTHIFISFFKWIAGRTDPRRYEWSIAVADVDLLYLAWWSEAVYYTRQETIWQRQDVL